jgi:hypothetical protein
MMLDCLAQQITNGDDGDNHTIADYRQMANAMLMHKSQAIREGMIEIDGHDVARHDTHNWSCLWRLVGHDHPPDAVAFRENANRRSSVQDNKKADILSDMMRNAVSTLSAGPTLHSAQGSEPRIRRSGR